MNPLTNVKNLQKLNERELELGIIGKKSWHDEYKDSAWIFIGGLPYDLSEGDIICVFSQYGEIVNINLVRDNKTGKSKGFAFICFQNQLSTVLSVDNLNGIKILGRVVRVDHVKDYKMPKERGDEDELTLKLRDEGCAPKIESSPEEVEETEDKKEKKKIKKEMKKKLKKEKKEKKKKKKKKKERDTSDDDSSSESEEERETTHHPIIPKDEIKEEKHDKGYDKAKHHGRRDSFDDGSESNDGRMARNKRWKDVRVKEEENNRKNNRERTRHDSSGGDADSDFDSRKDNVRKRIDNSANDNHSNSRGSRDFRNYDDRRDRRYHRVGDGGDSRRGGGDGDGNRNRGTRDHMERGEQHNGFHRDDRGYRDDRRSDRTTSQYSRYRDDRYPISDGYSSREPRDGGGHSGERMRDNKNISRGSQRERSTSGDRDSPRRKRHRSRSRDR